MADDKVNILLVDDHHENLMALESVLSVLGQNLVTAQSGTEALRYLLQDDFAVILLDVQMPEIDGFDTAMLIRQREKTRYTPIIFLTAINKSDVHVNRGYSLGAVDYVFKPFDPGILKAKVSAFVELSKKEKELKREIAHRKLAEEKLDSSNSLLETISGALVGFIAEANPGAAFSHLLGSILSLTGSEFGFIGEILHTSGGDPYLKSYALTQMGSDPSGTGQPGAQANILDLFNLKALCSTVHREAKPFIANDPGGIPRRRALPAGHPKLQNFLALPFFKGELLVGLAAMANRTGGYDEELIAYLQPFLNTCAILIDALHTEQRRQQAEDEVRRLNDQLERRVIERTAELRAANRELKNEILERKRAEDEKARLYALEQAARAEAEAAQHRLMFLGEASAVLGASLDYETTLERIAHLPVPGFADFCIVDMVDDDGQLRRVATAHIDPAKDELLKELQAICPPEWASQAATHRVLSTGKSELASEVTAPVSPSPNGSDPFTLIAALGVRSHLAVPLVARGQTIGVISMGSSASGNRYGSEDLVMAEDLASRAVAAIDNARLFRELHEAAHRKDEFLAMLAHELRNPLAAMSNAGYVLEEIGDHDSRVERLRSIISRQTQNLSRLVDDLLDISRITRGKISLKTEPLTVASLVHRAVESASGAIAAREHELTVSMPTEPMWVEADPMRLEQVVSNLLHNAIKYTEPGGHIWLTVECGGGNVELRVRDNGIGIAPELMPYIFDLFTQAERSLDRSQGGLGIGLALVKNLVQMHGGQVSCHSAGLGRGCEFSISLPLKDGPAEAKPDAPVPASALDDMARTQQSRRVLLVEDNSDAAETLTDILELWGHEVKVVSTGPAALAEAQHSLPEVVLLDIGLPGMDGYEVARRLRQGEQSSNMLLVALTGYGQDEDRRRSQEAGFDLHLTKPVDPWELRRLLEAVVATVPKEVVQ